MTHAFLSSETPRAIIDGQSFCPFMPVFGPPSVMFERGSGTELWDVDGKRYLDFLSGIAVVSLGHANPVIADAISSQARTLLHVSNFFANPVATRAAMAINELMRESTGNDGQVFFCNSGAEANEVAIKLARKFGGRGRHTVVSAFGSFHGRTLAALAATGQPAKHEPFQPMPEGFRHVPYGDVSALETALDSSVAALLLETVQGEGGVLPASTEYLQQAQRLCADRGILFIIDEVQTGFARTGRWFGFEHAGLRPDAICMAKGMGNGMPIGGLWAKKEVAAVFAPGDHGSTYSGTALATAATLAVIQEMRRIDAPRQAREKGELIRRHLDGTPGVDHIRGQGLLLGVALQEGLVAGDITTELLRQGLIVNAVNSSTLRLAPPLTTSEDHIAEACALITKVLTS